MPKQLLQIGLFGGTFDPIHNGHLHVAHHVLQQAALDQIQFIPCHQPTHRQLPLASAYDRFTMIELAIQQEPLFIANSLELNRHGPSYAVDTVKILAAKNQVLYFILGIDSFLQFHTWHQWQHILDFCHLIIVNRPEFDTPLPPALTTFYQNHLTNDIQQCRQQHAGCIIKLSIPPSPISSTQLRNMLRHQENCASQLPSTVLRYIKRQQLYL